jgi:hypothetical protein
LVADAVVSLLNPNPAAAEIVVPAQSSAAADFTTLATLFVDKVGSTTTVEASAQIRLIHSLALSNVSGKLILC